MFTKMEHFDESEKVDRRKERRTLLVSIVAITFCFILLAIMISLLVKMSSLKNKDIQQANKLNKIANQSKEILTQMNSAEVQKQIQDKEMDLKHQLTKLQLMANQTKILQDFSLIRQNVQSNKNKLAAMQQNFQDIKNETMIIQQNVRSNERDIIEMQPQNQNNLTQNESVINENPIFDCPGVTFRFPRDFQATDYVRYRGPYFPYLKEGTVCGWIEGTHNDARWRTIFGYASSANQNELVLFKYDAMFRIFKHGVSSDFSVESFMQQNQIRSLAKFHFCFLFSTSPGEFSFYINATRAIQNSFSAGAVSNQGKLLIGHELDSFSNLNNINPREAFIGNITNLVFWPRVLSDQEIQNVARRCECPKDYTVALTMDNSELNGDTTYDIPQSCPPF